MARRPTVLVVEDSDVMFGQYRAWLAADYLLIRAQTVGDALKQLYDAKPAAVLLDWVLAPDARHLPRGQRPPDGRDALRALRASALRDTWVVMATARAGLLNRLRSRQADAYLTKPVTEAALRAALLGMHRARRPVPPASALAPAPAPAWVGDQDPTPIQPQIQVPASAVLQGGS